MKAQTKPVVNDGVLRARRSCRELQGEDTYLFNAHPPLSLSLNYGQLIGGLSAEYLQIKWLVKMGKNLYYKLLTWSLKDMNVYQDVEGLMRNATKLHYGKCGIQGFWSSAQKSEYFCLCYISFDLVSHPCLCKWKTKLFMCLFNWTDFCFCFSDGWMNQLMNCESF